MSLDACLDPVVWLRHCYDLHAKQACLARHFRAWRRLRRFRLLEARYDWTCRQMYDALLGLGLFNDISSCSYERTLRIAMLRLQKARLVWAMTQWRQGAAFGEQRNRQFVLLLRRRLRANAFSKWRRMTWHDGFEEKVVAMAWVLLSRRAVRIFLGTLRAMRKRWLYKSLAKWQVYAENARWRDGLRAMLARCDE
ncbi:hypothetical protein LEN26_008222 [Aphanomyces euteiches]|nr:hypothetical protein AeMF1_004821 [Aphanomyces euteiches]KAH9130761.1 hypothetical protein LEN26_008222 [Aphanomyces euteiches]KAH9189431.1 hypothetical protein AeNC1_008591 [Aphanomyces euteiches]